MVANWYFILVFVAIGIVLFGTILVIIIKCCRKDRKGTYTEITQVELTQEPEDSKKKPLEDSTLTLNRDIVIPNFVQSSPTPKLDNVFNVNESSAELSCSDIDFDTGTVSAYGDTASVVSVASKASWLTMNTISNLNLSVQASLIYSREMRYVAGKVIQVEGLTFERQCSPSHVRVHVVVLPIKKYAMKTNWYEIQLNGRVRIEEYFKFVFKLPPSDTRTMFRLRVYGRRIKVGTFGKASCMGECYISLMEIVKARGGLTLWRTLSRGIPQAIMEGQTN